MRNLAFQAKTRYNTNMNEIRLFIAIEFPEDIKAELEKSAALLCRACERGTFTRRENFHLTLAFLGQVPPSRIREITDLMDACSAPPVPLTIGHMGRFKRREGDILWRQVEAEPALFQLQTALASRLRAQGFSLEDRDFKPHLTLARRAVLKDGVKLIDLSAKMPELEYTAASISLMDSEQRSGRRTYTVLHRTAMNAAR